jgi:hypothetical protein
MLSVLARIPLRESKNFVITCGVLFLTLLAARVYVDRQYDTKGSLEKRHKERVAEMRSKGLHEEANALRRDRTLTEQERRIQEWKAEGKSPAPESYVPVWLYKGLHANLVIAGLLLLASPWLGRRRRKDMKFAERPQAGAKRWEIAACVALMGLAAWHNAPRLFHSMWGDEEFNASRFIVDYAERGKEDGILRVKERPWGTTLWSMRKPTNHLGYSLFARLTHDAFFKKTTGPTDPWFSEALLRTPVFIAGLLLIPAFLWALRAWGLSGWWGLLLLLLHPWYTRFGVDGRGYGFVMLGAALMLGVLGRALQTGRWRWWLGFGFLGFFIVWSNMQGVYVVGAMNLTALACLLRRDLAGPGRWLLAARWFTANLLTLVIIVGYLAPCWPQLQEFMAKGEISGALDLRFWRDGPCAWFFGQPWQPWDEPQNPLLYAMLISLKNLPAVHVTGLILFCLLIVAGIAELSRKAELRPLLAFTLGAPMLMLLHMAWAGNRPYDWYFTNFLPGLFLLAAAGAMFVVDRFSRRRPAVLLLTSVIGLYAFITQQPRTLLRNHPLESSRESVALYRTKVTNPRHPDIDKGVISGALAMFTEGYDPALRRCENAEDLRNLMAMSDNTMTPLYVNVGFIKFLRQDKAGTGGACDLLENPGLFEHIMTLPGLLHSTTRDVFRYRGKAR